MTQHLDGVPQVRLGKARPDTDRLSGSRHRVHGEHGSGLDKSGISVVQELESAQRGGRRFVVVGDTGLPFSIVHSAYRIVAPGGKDPSATGADNVVVRVKESRMHHRTLGVNFADGVERGNDLSIWSHCGYRMATHRHRTG